MGRPRTSEQSGESSWRRGGIAGWGRNAGNSGRTRRPVTFRASGSGNKSMKTVAVLGGGPAGSFAAERLARAGLRTIIFDEKLAWEKPCGGGLTYKAYQEYPFLIENDTPKKLIHSTSLCAPKGGAVKM